MFKTFQFALSFAALLTGPLKSQTQNVALSDGPQNGVVLTKLAQPVYPPLARQLRVTGDVALMLSIRQDGGVESAALESGHPLLAEAALTSVRQSQFECRGCSRWATSYRLVYTFNLDSDCPCPPRDSNSKNADKQQFYPRVTEAEHRVIKRPGGTSIILGGIYPYANWGETMSGHLTDMAIDWLKDAARSDRPFLLRVSHL